MNTIKARVAAGVSVLALMALAACGGSDDTKADASSDTSDLSGVTIKFASQSGQIPLGIENSGVLDGADYKVEFVQLDSTTMVGALTTAKADIGTLSESALYLAEGNATPAWEKGKPLLQGILVTDNIDAANFPAQLTLVGKNSGIKTPADLKGKKYSYTPGTAPELLFLKTLELGGLNPDDVTPVELTPGNLGATALAQGDVDAWSGSASYAKAALQAGATVLTDSNQAGVPALGTLISPTKSLDDPKKSAAIDDFLGRYIKFLLWNIENEEGGVETWVRTLKTEGPVARETWLTRRDSPLTIDDALLAKIQESADTLFERGTLKRKVDVRDEFDTRSTDIIEKAFADLDFEAKAKAAVERTKR